VKHVTPSKACTCLNAINFAIGAFGFLSSHRYRGHVLCFQYRSWRSERTLV